MKTPTRTERLNLRLTKAEVKILPLIAKAHARPGVKLNEQDAIRIVLALEADRLAKLARK